MEDETPTVNPKVNYGLWKIMWDDVVHPWFKKKKKKHSVSNIDSGGSYTCVEARDI